MKEDNVGKGRVMSSDLPGPNELGGKTVPTGKEQKAALITAEPQDREVVGRWILAGEDPLLKSGRERGQKMVPTHTHPSGIWVERGRTE